MVHSDDIDNLDALLDEWDNPGVLVHADTNAYDLITALSRALDVHDISVDNVDDAIHLDTASDGHLEKLGELGNVDRKTGESDAKYRERIRANLRASITGTTVDETIEVGTVIFDTDAEDIRLDENFDTTPATITISIFKQALDNSALTTSEVTDIFEDLVPAGHAVVVSQRGTFELLSAGDSNDTSKGLTSSGVEGGTLAKSL